METLTRETIKREDAFNFILDKGNLICGVAFIKRTNGQLRKMAARTNVTKGLKGGLPPYDPAKHDLLWVFDMNAGRRSIPREGLLEIRFGGKIYQVVD